MYDLSFRMDDTWQLGVHLVSSLNSEYYAIRVTLGNKGAVPKRLHPFKLSLFPNTLIIHHTQVALVDREQTGSHCRTARWGHRTERKTQRRSLGGVGTVSVIQWLDTNSALFCVVTARLIKRCMSVACFGKIKQNAFDLHIAIFCFVIILARWIVRCHGRRLYKWHYKDMSLPER